ncbi:phage baseplate assembly protein V [Tepidicaulis sp. LMO-SS28]|uniref:phage baseplate assembly protein V n=1 Tax=Tepidicaulis sp. LMO-SS28 TaxID=3447455 RepID=UPI003EE35E9D
MLDLEYRIAELERRLANIAQLGTISAADYGKARVRVNIGERQSGWLPWTAARAGEDRTWWAPEIGEQVLVISPSGNPAQGVVMPAIYSQTAPAPGASADVAGIKFADGTVIEYSRGAGRLFADVKGDVEIVAEGGVTVEAEGDVTVTSAAAIAVEASASVSITAPVVSIQSTSGSAAQAALTGNFTLEGNLDVTGNINATGSILAGGANSNHHTH